MSILCLIVSGILSAYVAHKSLVDSFVVQQATLLGTTNFKATDPLLAEVSFVGIDAPSACISSCASNSHSVAGIGMAGSFSCRLARAPSGDATIAGPDVCIVSFVTAPSAVSLPSSFSLSFVLPGSRSQILFYKITSLYFAYNGATSFGLSQSLAPPISDSIFLGYTPTQVSVGLQPWVFVGDPEATNLPAAAIGYVAFLGKPAELGSYVDNSTYWNVNPAAGVSIVLSFSTVQTVQSFSLLSVGGLTNMLSAISALVLGGVFTVFSVVMGVGETINYMWQPAKLFKDMVCVLNICSSLLLSCTCMRFLTHTLNCDTDLALTDHGNSTSMTAMRLVPTVNRIPTRTHNKAWLPKREPIGTANRSLTPRTTVQVHVQKLLAANLVRCQVFLHLALSSARSLPVAPLEVTE